MKEKRKVYAIGTIHGGYTPENELISVLENLDPDQVLVELPRGTTAEDFTERNDIRVDMLAAYMWAKQKDIHTAFIDEPVPLFREGKNEKDPMLYELNKKVLDVVKKHSWKDFNNSEINKILSFPEEDILFDPEKDKKREYAMLENVKQAMLQKGNVVIVVGTDHLDFLYKHIPDVILPLRT